MASGGGVPPGSRSIAPIPRKDRSLGHGFAGHPADGRDAIGAGRHGSVVASVQRAVAIDAVGTRERAGGTCFADRVAGRGGAREGTVAALPAGARAVGAFAVALRVPALTRDVARRGRARELALRIGETGAVAVCTFPLTGRVRLTADVARRRRAGDLAGRARCADALAIRTGDGRLVAAGAEHQQRAEHPTQHEPR